MLSQEELVTVDERAGVRSTPRDIPVLALEPA
jgi:hypothetical protein